MRPAERNDGRDPVGPARAEPAADRQRAEAVADEADPRDAGPRDQALDGFVDGRQVVVDARERRLQVHRLDRMAAGREPVMFLPL